MYSPSGHPRWTVDEFVSLSEHYYIKDILWMEDSYFGQNYGLMLKHHGLVSYKTYSKPSQNINWWTGVVWIICGLLWCFYHLFGLSFWRHPFTAEDPLMSKWCNATFLQNWWRNKLTYILDGLRGIHFQQIFIFVWTVPLSALYLCFF